MTKKKIWASFQIIIELVTQKFVTKLSKIWDWDPGSEIRDPEKTYSGSRIRVQWSKRHRIPDPDPQHWCPDERLSKSSCRTDSMLCGGSQRDVFYLSWPIAPSYMSPNAGGRGAVACGGVSANEYSCTTHGAQINFRDLNSIFNLVLWICIGFNSDPDPEI